MRLSAIKRIRIIVTTTILEIIITRRTTASINCLRSKRNLRRQLVISNQSRISAIVVQPKIKYPTFNLN